MSGTNKKYALATLVLVIFILLRTINLTILPIFNDESTYIRYGIHQLNEPSHQPYSLLIGKEPLDPFLYAFVGSMIGNLLVGARLVTIVYGLLTLIGLYLYTKTFIGKRAAIIAAFFYVFAPFTVFFDRLALLDSSVSTIAIWTLYVTHLLFKKSSWRYGLGLGFLMGIGLWVKTTDLFYLFLPYISYAFFYFSNGDKNMVKAKMLFCAFLIAMLVFLPLFSNPYYSVLMQLLQQYTYPITSVFLFPVTIWWNNLTGIVEWLFFYLTPPLFSLAVGSLIMAIKQKKFLFVLLWFFLPLIYEILYAKLFTSRQTLLLTVPLFILAGYGFSQLWQKQKTVAVILGVCILVWSLFDSFILLTTPQKYPSLFLDKAQVDADQYFYGFSSGYGVLEAINYVQQQAAADGRIIVVIRNDHGNPEDAVVAYLDYKSNVILVPMNDPPEDVQKIFQQVGNNIPVYFVARGKNNGGLENNFESEKKFFKPNDTEFVGVVRLKPI